MIYLDNAATTKPNKAATDAIMRAAEDFGNPSSLHGLGFKAEKNINESRDILAKILKADKKNIIFTSGGTEANNLALFGISDMTKRTGKRIITSKIEHPSVLESAKKLESMGYDVVYADVLSDGRVDLEGFKKLLTPDTTLVSIMHVNNETGVIQPIEEIAKAAKAVSPKCIIHSDCVQSFGKIPVVPSKMGVDAVTISSHKIHGFKGTGALYLKNPRITPVIYGGEQQNELRPGTENVGGILAFAAAAKECDINSDKMIKLRSLMIDRLSELIPNICINGSNEYNSGSVLNVSFLGIKAEILLHSLERHEIYVSTGSACSSHKPQPSHVLTAMNCSKEAVTGAIRISFCADTTDEDVLYAADKIAEETAQIRKYMRS